MVPWPSCRTKPPAVWTGPRLVADRSRWRLVEAEVNKAELEASLQDLLWKEKHARATRDAALKDIEASFSRVVALEDRLSESEGLLHSRDKELNNLRLELKAATTRSVEKTASGNQETQTVPKLAPCWSYEGTSPGRS